MSDEICTHEHVHTERAPYRVVCNHCGAERYPRGYWPDDGVGETVVLDRDAADLRTQEERLRLGFLPPWGT